MTTQTILDVMMQDIVGDDDTPDFIDEWQWVKSISSFSHNENGDFGIWEFFVNVYKVQHSGDRIPEKLLPVFEEAIKAGHSFVWFHQGT